MPDPCELSVVLPAYREADSLRILLPRLVPLVNAGVSRSEIIVSDPMEPLDNTEAVCAQNDVSISAVPGEQLWRRGTQRHTALPRPFLLLMDADGSHNPR